ncbi:carbohydrate-binding domain-containing protein [Paraflavitalea pollutisoli]|uniref:carbohydrate-binding domain-containing protein n=1 Tax=Paraflavitalea pollutisoli TaxID=3034143 RepID=UPI0023EC8835|nr:carbohydrate-binding domain-containing protein [Paraflavitalea sp. H1-2-19X]
MMTPATQTRPAATTGPLKPLLTSFIILFTTLGWLSACSDKAAADEATTGSTTATIDSTAITSGTAEGGTQTGYDAEDILANSTFGSIVTINFGSTVTISNPLSAAGVTIVQSGQDLTVTSTVAGVEYQLSGTTTNGSVKIYSDKKFKLTLNGVNITHADGPAINIQSSKRAFVVINDNTTNSLTDGASYATSAEDQKATFFSEGQLVFSGHGSLDVKGNYKHGIASDDYIRVISGTITVTGAVTDGFHTNDAFIVDGGTLKVTAASDGIECEEGYVIVNDGNLTLNTGDDGIAASYEEEDASIDPYVTINGGTINVTSTAGEGIESKSVLTINKGNITVKTADDGLNAGTAIYINGGNVYAYSTGNDAMDSNGIFTITGGKILAVGARAPEASIDCDARTLKITGGILVGIAGATSGPTASVSTVPSVILGSGSANQVIHIEAADGTEALTFQAPIAYSTMIYASAKLKTGTSYRVYTGGSVTDGVSFNGLYMSGTYSKGSSSTSFTTNTMVTQVGGSMSRG